MAGYSGGVYTRVHRWVDDRLANLDITDTRMDEEDDSIADALSRCILKDGTQTITADIPMNGKKITGLGAATLAGDALNMGTADARYVSTVAPAMSGALIITSSVRQGACGGSDRRHQSCIFCECIGAKRDDRRLYPRVSSGKRGLHRCDFTSCQ